MTLGEAFTEVATRLLRPDNEWRQVDVTWLYVAFMLGLGLGVAMGIWG